jgi:hypothetical protein
VTAAAAKALDDIDAFLDDAREQLARAQARSDARTDVGLVDMLNEAYIRAEAAVNLQALRSRGLIPVVHHDPEIGIVHDIAHIEDLEAADDAPVADAPEADAPAA